MKNSYYPLFIINHRSNEKDSVRQLCEFEILHQKYDITKNEIEERIFLTEAELAASEIQKNISKAEYSVQSKKVRVFYVFWFNKLKENGNYNKLLKFFEEPPQRTIIFIINNGHILPRTITSRGVTLTHLNESKASDQADETSLNALKAKMKEFLEGNTDMGSILSELKADQTTGEELISDLLIFLAGRRLNCQKYTTLSKIIIKYNQSKKINLNKFDNILIPLRHIARDINVDMSDFK